MERHKSQGVREDKERNANIGFFFFRSSSVKRLWPVSCLVSRVPVGKTFCHYLFQIFVNTYLNEKKKLLFY